MSHAIGALNTLAAAFFSTAFCFSFVNVGSLHGDGATHTGTAPREGARISLLPEPPPPLVPACLQMPGSARFSVRGVSPTRMVKLFLSSRHGEQDGCNVLLHWHGPLPLRHWRLSCRPDWVRSCRPKSARGSSSSSGQRQQHRRGDGGPQRRS